MEWDHLITMNQVVSMWTELAQNHIKLWATTVICEKLLNIYWPFGEDHKQGNDEKIHMICEIYVLMVVTMKNTFLWNVTYSLGDI
jgi:hypothetical protein